MPASHPAGYSGTPLVKKLGIKENSRVHLIDAPAKLPSLLGPLPAGVRFDGRLTKDTDLVHVFVTRRRKMEDLLARLRPRVRPDAAVWVSWPKKAAKMETDITEDLIRDTALPLGFVDVKVCAVSEVWSGLKLCIRRELR